MRKKVTCLFASLFLMIGTMGAQYTVPGEGVYRIINAEYESALTENVISSTLMCSPVSDDEAYEQLWVLKSSGVNYSIQNAYTGRYIQTGNNGTEVPYWTDASPKAFSIVANPDKGGDAYNIFDPFLGSAGLHSKGVNGAVVRWWTESHKAASEWKFVSVDVSLDDLEAIQSNLGALIANEQLYDTLLTEYFADMACTSLKHAYQSMSDDELTSAMQTAGLPQQLIAMALKVKNEAWSEDNENPDKPAWDGDYAKKFRVQLIEPHSIAGEVTEHLHHHGHSNMDNPMGLYANARDVLFIMVEGDIQEGAELWANFITGHGKMPNYNNGYTNGMRLHSGLNVVPCAADGSALFLNYLVHTYDRYSQSFAHKLSDFSDLKVHVFGGYVNGCYNAVGDALYAADTDYDWEYYEERANMRNITLVGRHTVLQFELGDVTIEDNGRTYVDRGLARLFPDELPSSLPAGERINAIIEAWDRIVLSEKITLGEASQADVAMMNQLFPRWDVTWTRKAEMYDYTGYQDFCNGIDYSDYYNHRALAFGTTSGYMYGSWDHTGYHINTTPSILTAIATEPGPTWGPAHEVGHQHQTLFTTNGLTEVTNNFFSNIAVWYMGMGTSRVNGTQGNLAHVYDVYRNGGDFFDNNIWAMTQMYYRLWLYYHRAGHNTQFCPRLFELLRRQPMVTSRGSGTDETEDGTRYFQYTDGATTILHFYQLCCDAAQEDLTEFFRAYGFFRVMDDRFVSDYTNSKYTQSQADIDQAIAAVKSRGYRPNVDPLFINDCTPNVTYRHDGATPRSYWDYETSRSDNAEVGCYVDFMRSDSLIGSYLCELAVTDLTITGDGAGAVGFAVFSSAGEILAFTNHHTIALTDEVATMLRYGGAHVEAIIPGSGYYELPLKVQPNENEPETPSEVYYLSVGTTLTHPSSTITIPISMENSGDVTAFQFDLYLPAGISVATSVEDDEVTYDITYNSDRAKRTHVIACEPQANGSIRVAGYSTANALYAGNSGELLYVTLSVGDLPDGDYLVEVRNVRMAAPDGYEAIAGNSGAYLSVRHFPQGDVNGDYLHTMSDVVMLVNAVLHRYQEAFLADVADMNGDSELSMGDVVRVLRLVLTGGRAMAPERTPESAAVAMPVLSAGPLTTLADGRMALAVSLANEAAYSAFQVDVTLPAGVTLADATLTARARASHTVAWDHLPDGRIRLVAYATSNAAFRGHEGEVLHLVLDGATALSTPVAMHLTDGLFVTHDGCEHRSHDVSVPMYVVGTGLASASAPMPRVVGIEGAVTITCHEATDLSIHTPTGVLVKHFTAEAGTHTIALPQGTYVIGGLKVRVR